MKRVIALVLATAVTASLTVRPATAGAASEAVCQYASSWIESNYSAGTGGQIDLEVAGHDRARCFYRVSSAIEAVPVDTGVLMLIGLRPMADGRWSYAVGSR